MTRHTLACLAGLLWLASTLPSHAQIDPEKRRLLQLGYNQPTQGRGPIAGYAFFYYNQPQFIRTNLTLRLAVAPVFLDSQLGITGAITPYTDLALGLAGGGFADSYSEIRQGHLYREESFTGHSAEANVSIFHRFNPDQQIPLNGVLKLTGHLSMYERDDNTSKDFKVPDDESSFRLRTGLLWGGREPLMTPDRALELSVWYEGAFRTGSELYGFGGDRQLEAHSHLFWTRALFAYRLPESRQSFQASLTAGASVETDRLSAYRLGGSLPLVSDYPLDLPGYYFQEITATRFILLSGMYEVPLNPSKTVGFVSYASTAIVDYLPGADQPGNWLSGVGGGFTFESPKHTWKVLLGYSYGINAIRSGERGAHNVGILFQYDLAAVTAKMPSFLNPNKWRGFDRIFRH